MKGIDLSVVYVQVFETIPQVPRKLSKDPPNKQQLELTCRSSSAVHLISAVGTLQQFKADNECFVVWEIGE